MKAEELMVGNWVSYKGKNYKVAMFGSECQKGVLDGILLCPIEYWQPIPLTEEWLLKFGFKTDFYGGQGNVCYYASKGKFKIYSLEDNKSYQYDYTTNMFTMIKHVHELQNLYYALKKQELTIN